MTVWSYVFLKLGLLLLILGAAPALIAGLFFPGADPLVPVLLSLSVAPLGALALLAGAIMWVAGRLRR
jgi:hypothetical protein